MASYLKTVGSSDEDVPETIRSKVDAVWALVEPFCRERLNDEYANLCHRLLLKMARDQTATLSRGTPETWAAGMVRAIGHNNFLDDPTGTPHLKSKVIDESFGVSTATATTRSRKIRELLKIANFDPGWTLPSLMSQNPAAYLINANGFIVDSRTTSPEVQQEALRRGIVPREVLKNAPASSPATTQLFELDVFILSGMITRKFLKKHKQISRVILIRGDQTLDDLHHIIFKAFDRFDEHMYEFQFGKGPHDPKGTRYRRSMRFDFGLDGDGGPPIGNAETKRIDSLRLTDQSVFGYWFDFGDDWWHQINVVKIHPDVPKGTYPMIKSVTGKSPPQYPDPDEMD